MAHRGYVAARIEGVQSQQPEYWNLTCVDLKTGRFLSCTSGLDLFFSCWLNNDTCLLRDLKTLYHWNPLSGQLPMKLEPRPPIEPPSLDQFGGSKDLLWLYARSSTDTRLIHVPTAATYSLGCTHGVALAVPHSEEQQKPTICIWCDSNDEFVSLSRFPPPTRLSSIRRSASILQN